MKISLIIAYVLIGILAFFAIMQMQSLSKMKSALATAIEKMQAQQSADAVDKRSANEPAGNWMDELQKELKDVKEFELKFQSK